MKYGNKIKLLREEMNMSREDLSIALNIKYATLSKYETSDREPDFNTLVQIAKFFNVSTDYLLGNTIVRTPIQTTAAHMIDPNHEYTPEEEEEIRDFMEYVCAKAAKKKIKDN